MFNVVASAIPRAENWFFFQRFSHATSLPAFVLRTFRFGKVSSLQEKGDREKDNWIYCSKLCARKWGRQKLRGVYRQPAEIIRYLSSCTHGRKTAPMNVTCWRDAASIAHTVYTNTLYMFKYICNDLASILRVLNTNINLSYLPFPAKSLLEKTRTFLKTDRIYLRELLVRFLAILIRTYIFVCVGVWSIAKRTYVTVLYNGSKYGVCRIIN